MSLQFHKLLGQLDELRQRFEEVHAFEVSRLQEELAQKCVTAECPTRSVASPPPGSGIALPHALPVDEQVSPAPVAADDAKESQAVPKSLPDSLTSPTSSPSILRLASHGQKNLHQVSFLPDTPKSLYANSSRSRTGLVKTPRSQALSENWSAGVPKTPTRSGAVVVSSRMLRICAMYNQLHEQAAKRYVGVLEFLDSRLQEYAGRGRRNSFVKFATVVEMLEKELGHASPEHFSKESFVDLMTANLHATCLSKDIKRQIHLVRAMLTQDDFVQMVAECTHLQQGAFEQEERDLHQVSMFSKILEWTGLLMIVANASIMLISADMNPDDDDTWNVIELMFTIFFVFELGCKCWVSGTSIFLFGPEWHWNMTDTVIVGLAVIDSIMSMGVGSSGTSIFTMMRLFRLARITKLMRLLRFKIFKELLLMVKGVISGLRTLFWAVILLFIVIAILGYITRQTIGTWCSEKNMDRNMSEGENSWCTDEVLRDQGQQLFGTVVAASFTTLRCFTEGCASATGTPLLVHVWNNRYGEWLVLIYVLSFLSVTFGLFNLIMAVFVENTAEAAKLDERKRKLFRKKQQAATARKLQKLVVHFCQEEQSRAFASEGSDRKSVSGRIEAVRECNCRSWCHNMFEAWNEWRTRTPEHELLSLSHVNLDIEITREKFEEAFADPKMDKMLQDLEITLDDPMNLFEAIDANGNGCLDAIELIQGLMKFLGSADDVKSNLVAALLSVRSIQKHLSDLDARMSESSALQRYTTKQFEEQLLKSTTLQLPSTCTDE